MVYSRQTIPEGETMIELTRRQWIENGKSRILICGEIHYFRIPVERWQKTFDLAREAGINAIATYVPWHMHEETEGDVDWTGRTRPELNLPAFLRLAQDNGFDVFFRPGPFIMAEMKNEGIPYWLRAKHPHLVSTSWDGAVVGTAALDYTHPDFLAETRKYYHSMMPHIRPFLRQNGGPIVAIQLDNEIGMLSWVSNMPDLTGHVIESFRAFLKKTGGPDASVRHPRIDDAEFAAGVKTPSEAYAPVLHHDLGMFNRARFAEYAAALARMFDDEGVSGIPYVINVHGTSAGRALLFPIGLSQLMSSYDRPGFLAGSDLYLGEFSMENFHDFYVVNGMQESLNHQEQPLATVEFNCGDGNWGDSLSTRLDPASTSLKTRMCLAHGHKLINYYLFAGGRNPRMFRKPGDGNDRIAITGERHGFAAPVGPEGNRNLTFDRLAEVNGVALANAALLAPMRLVTEPVALGWIPDLFMTESRYPKSRVMKSLYADLERHRAGQLWDVFAKLFLLRHANPAILDLQDGTLPPSDLTVLAVEGAKHMPPSVQERLTAYVKDGGNLLFCGELPVRDLDDRPCTILSDALGIRPTGLVHEWERPYLSVVPEGWLAGFPEHQTHVAQTVEPDGGVPLYRLYGTGEVCAFEKSVGAGRIVAFLTALPANLDLVDALFARFGYAPSLRDDYPYHGIVAMKTADTNAAALHLVNVDNVDKTFHLYEDGKPLFGGAPVHLPGRDGLILPCGADAGPFRIVWSTLEIAAVSGTSVTFRAVPGDHVVRLVSARPVRTSAGALGKQGKDGWTVAVHLNSDHREVVVSTL